MTRRVVDMLHKNKIKAIQQQIAIWLQVLVACLFYNLQNGDMNCWCKSGKFYITVNTTKCTFTEPSVSSFCACGEDDAFSSCATWHACHHRHWEEGWRYRPPRYCRKDRQQWGFWFRTPNAGALRTITLDIVIKTHSLFTYQQGWTQRLRRKP
jgi:hypothetical protein